MGVGCGGVGVGGGGAGRGPGDPKKPPRPPPPPLSPTSPHGAKIHQKHIPYHTGPWRWFLDNHNNILYERVNNAYTLHRPQTEEAYITYI